ncbi:MAG: hypothetical protein LAT62_05700 [Natronospirillum sp.]|uniref:hypothetical protein n=1 Tax=Natronospirillum sp. TaxID=2812955 RepID=UPI0025CDC219|nr:hypothetical protein [Natronospirillum sp.]MCH8551410.1 hypothetical protein [Natronospirillum sp.]
MNMVRTAAVCLSLGLVACGSPGGGSSSRPMNPLDAATSAMGEAAGRAIGEAVGEAIVRQYSPQLTRFYTGYLMQVAFNSQGYILTDATRGYEPGEYTEWVVVTDDEDVPENVMRRALLERQDDGQEWWQVIYQDNASDDIIIMEALFSENREQMLRLRTQFPDDDEPQEMPVDDQNYQSPRVLTQESIDGATEGQETIDVPAGTFDATRVRFGAGGGQETWWLSDQVPGGIVQHQVSSVNGEDAPDDEEAMPGDAYTTQLQSYGTGATSELGI